METVIKLLLIVHVVAGTLSLTSGLLAILLRNKVKIHRSIGKTYFWAMTVVFVTAVIVSTAHSNLFLFCVAFFHLLRLPDRLPFVASETTAPGSAACARGLVD